MNQKNVTLTNECMELLETTIKKLQTPLKKDMKPAFLGELRNILEKCFMMPKLKKEHFISKEKLTHDFLKLLQSQKRFKPSDNVFSGFRYLAVYDNNNEIGRVISLNINDNTVEYITYNNRLKSETTKKHFRDVELFDYNSKMMEHYFSEHSRFIQGGNYVQMYAFLSKENYIPVKESFKEEIKTSSKVGKDLIAEIIEEYGLPNSTSVKTKKLLLQICPEKNDTIKEHESVKSAADDLKISPSTISNVLCQGKSASKYLIAGGFKWQYSDLPNGKYI